MKKHLGEMIKILLCALWFYVGIWYTCRAIYIARGVKLLDWENIVAISLAGLGLVTAIVLLIKDVLGTKRGFEATSKENDLLSKEHDALSIGHRDIMQLVEKKHEKLVNEGVGLQSAVRAVDKDLAVVSEKINSELLRRSDLTAASTMSMKDIQRSIDSLAAINELLKETNHENAVLRVENTTLHAQLEQEKNKTCELRIANEKLCDTIRRYERPIGYEPDIDF